MLQRALMSGNMKLAISTFARGPAGDIARFLGLFGVDIGRTAIPPYALANASDIIFFFYFFLIRFD